MPPVTTYGDISPRTAGYVARELLERGQPLMIVSQFGLSKPLPKHTGKTIKFRRYEHLSAEAKVLIEGVTPQASKPTFQDYEATIKQYGDYVELTDVIEDTHEDPILKEFSEILGEQAAEMLERATIGTLMGGTNVYFSGETGGTMATSRAGVNKPLTLSLQRRIIQGLKRQLALPITKVVNPSANYDTSAIQASYVGICHTDLEHDIRDMPGFVPVEKYGSRVPMRGEIGSVEGIRYCTTTLMSPFLNAGAAPASGESVMSDEGTCADVYPIFYLGKNAFGNVPFARGGKNGLAPISPMVLNPNTPRGGDPLGQRGTIGWKAYHTALILYDFWLARAEVAATLP